MITGEMLLGSSPRLGAAGEIRAVNPATGQGDGAAASDGRSTWVGTLAVRRFLRLVCYQDFPEGLLPRAVREKNPNGLWRQRDGIIGRQ